MGFNADLNPKKSSMDLGDLLKMDEAMTKNKLYKDAANAKKSIVVTPAKPNIADNSVPFKYGNNYQSED
jgi:hypothetical protein